MPTQEERLSALEQTVAAFSRDIRDISHNETILLGMAMKQQEQTREIRSSLASLSEHLDTFEQSVNSRFGVVETRLGGVETRLGGVETRFGGVETTLGGLETRLGGLETTLNEHTAVLAQILARLPEKP